MSLKRFWCGFSPRWLGIWFFKSQLNWIVFHRWCTFEQHLWWLTLCFWICVFGLNIFPHVSQIKHKIWCGFWRALMVIACVLLQMCIRIEYVSTCVTNKTQNMVSGGLCPQYGKHVRLQYCTLLNFFTHSSFYKYFSCHTCGKYMEMDEHHISHMC